MSYNRIDSGAPAGRGPATGAVSQDPLQTAMLDLERAAQDLEKVAQQLGHSTVDSFEPGPAQAGMPDLDAQSGAGGGKKAKGGGKAAKGGGKAAKGGGKAAKGGGKAAKGGGKAAKGGKAGKAKKGKKAKKAKAGAEGAQAAPEARPVPPASQNPVVGQLMQDLQRLMNDLVQMLSGANGGAQPPASTAQGAPAQLPPTPAPAGNTGIVPPAAGNTGIVPPALQNGGLQAGAPASGKASVAHYLSKLRGLTDEKLAAREQKLQARLASGVADPRTNAKLNCVHQEQTTRAALRAGAQPDYAVKVHQMSKPQLRQEKAAQKARLQNPAEAADAQQKLSILRAEKAARRQNHAFGNLPPKAQGGQQLAPRQQQLLNEVNRLIAQARRLEARV